MNTHNHNPHIIHVSLKSEVDWHILSWMGSVEFRHWFEWLKGLKETQRERERDERYQLSACCVPKAAALQGEPELPLASLPHSQISLPDQMLAVGGVCRPYAAFKMKTYVQRRPRSARKLKVQRLCGETNEKWAAGSRARSTPAENISNQNIRTWSEIFSLYVLWKLYESFWQCQSLTLT